MIYKTGDTVKYKDIEYAEVVCLECGHSRINTSELIKKGTIKEISMKFPDIDISPPRIINGEIEDVKVITYEKIPHYIINEDTVSEEDIIELIGEK